MIITKIKLRLKWMWNDLLFSLGKEFQFNQSKGAIRVLCFHGLCNDEDKYINSRFLFISRFRKLIQLVHTHYHIISLQDFINGNTLSNKLNILLTFDDGYRNLKDLLIPVIEDLKIPVTLFVNNCTFHLMDYLDIAIDQKMSLDSLTENVHSGKIKNGDQFKSWAKTQNKEVLNNVKSSLSEIVAPVLKKYKIFHELLTEDELKDMIKNKLISVANHSENHLSFTHIGYDDLHKELQTCNDYITKLGSPYGNIFAYPYGHYNDLIQTVLREKNYQHQFIVDHLSNDKRTTYERLVVNPHITINNQLLAIEHGTYV